LNKERASTQIILRLDKPPIVSYATSPISQFLDETAMIGNLPPRLQALIQRGKEKRASGGDISDEMM